MGVNSTYIYTNRTWVLITYYYREKNEYDYSND